jgi:hypothetical protein
VLAMHVDGTELTGAIICAIAIIRFWRLILVFVLLAVVCAMVLGFMAVVSYIHH